MREERKFPAWVAVLAAWAAVLFIIPNGFLAFVWAVVVGGMVAINAGEQLRKDRERRRAHG